jgi:hypothetical protein
MLKKQISAKLLLILLVLLIPFSISDYSDNVEPEKITSDLRFYEINTCSISLNEFLIENPNVIYQDHYKIRFNNYSSIRCFGQITGIDQIGYTFYISIGTNTLINLFLQSLFWILFLSFFPKKKDYEFNYRQIIFSAVIAFMVCILIYSEFRYYQKTIFEMDLSLYDAYKYLFVFLFLVTYLSSTLIDSRTEAMLNYFPFLYLFIGVFSGTNIYFWLLPFTALGLKYITSASKLFRFMNIIHIIIFFWSFQAMGENYYLEPDKIRGLSLTSYNFLTTFIWSYLIFSCICGIYKYMKISSPYLDYIKLTKNFLLTGFFILSLGYIGSSMPYINFMNYYYFGQNKYGTDNHNLFQNNAWGESIAWRGFYPSAETVGEFFAFSILLFIIIKINSKVDWSYDFLLLVPIAAFGLFLSNNKAATFSLMLTILFIISKTYEVVAYKKYALYIGVLLLLIYFIRIENLLFSFEFTRDKILEMANLYGYDYGRSSGYLKMTSIKNDGHITYFIISIFSGLSFLINRSELWGLFVSRYNPSFQEFLFGSGPYSLANHYSEINVSPIRVNTDSQLGFLLPHSSLLLLLIFIGLLGVAIVLLALFFKLKKMKKLNYEAYLLLFFTTLNLIKSDSILYFSSVFTILFLLNIDKKQVALKE